ncbi:MAG: UvrD-helicase domain-containing protein [Planctomycetes bacterium]|nr:UvrD-helicase domain-containing protein [Planctomycetota bacterium]
MFDADALVHDLNEPQREAVLHGDGPLLIVAGAGSGKTRVITRRIAHLIQRGVRPSEILAITFTNKAAGEMRERVLAMIDEGGGAPWLATFHAFCARVLRAEGERVGLAKGYTIYDTDDQLALVKEQCREHSIDTQAFRPRALLSAISRMKNDGVHPDEAEAAAISSYDHVTARVYGLYAKALSEANAADFDDLLLKVVQLFRENADVLQKYQQRFRHVLVDEYQDTNSIQDKIARSIALGHGNLCVTGDPDQSIYRWRGARVENILEFTKDFPDAHVVRLAQNYRSTNRILRAASSVIGHNPGRLLGDLWSELGEGAAVTIMSHADEETEADAVVRLLREWTDEGRRLSEIAIFYRTNALSRGLERALRLYNVSYDIVGAVEFYQRREVKDLLAFLRVLVNPDDALSFLRIVNVPGRGIGKTSLDKLRAWALPQGIGPREAARRAHDCPGLTRKPKKALVEFSALLDGLVETLDGPPEDTLRAIVERTRYEDFLRDFGGTEAVERLENVQELEAALAAYVRNATEPTVLGFLEETALVADSDGYDDSSDKVTLMTMHAAKGLEFPAVIIVGLEEGLLPHVRAFDSELDLHEERRLLYVGMTRAQQRLVLSHALRRQRQGQWMPGMASRFLDELPDDEIERDDRTEVAGSWGGSSGGWGGGARARGGWTSGRVGAAEGSGDGAAGGSRGRRAGSDDPFAGGYVPDPDDYLDEPALPRPGQAVRHAHFGEGVVLDVQGTGGKARITVRFRRFGDKQLMAEYARLEPA